MIRQFVVILCVALVVSMLSVSLASSTSSHSYRGQGHSERPSLQKTSHFDNKITAKNVFRFGSSSRELRYRDLPPLPRIRPGGYIQLRVFRPLPRPPFHYSPVSRII